MSNDNKKIDVWLYKLKNRYYLLPTNLLGIFLASELSESDLVHVKKRVAPLLWALVIYCALILICFFSFSLSVRFFFYPLGYGLIVYPVLFSMFVPNKQNVGIGERLQLLLEREKTAAKLSNDLLFAIATLIYFIPAIISLMNKYYLPAGVWEQIFSFPIVFIVSINVLFQFFLALYGIWEKGVRRHFLRS